MVQPAQGSITTDTMQCILQSHSHTQVTKVHLYSNNQRTINNYKQTSNTICNIEPLKSTSKHESNFSEKWHRIQILNSVPKKMATEFKIWIRCQNFWHRIQIYTCFWIRCQNFWHRIQNLNSVAKIFGTEFKIWIRCHFSEKSNWTIHWCFGFHSEHLSAFDGAICDARWKISSPYLAHSYHGSTINMYVLLL